MTSNSIYEPPKLRALSILYQVWFGVIEGVVLLILRVNVYEEYTESRRLAYLPVGRKITKWCYDNRLIESHGKILVSYLKSPKLILGLLVFITSPGENIPIRSLHIGRVRSAGTEYCLEFRLSHWKFAEPTEFREIVQKTLGPDKSWYETCKRCMVVETTEEFLLALESAHSYIDGSSALKELMTYVNIPPDEKWK